MRLSLYIALIIFVVSAAFMLRFYRLMDFTDWSGDSGRDVLVARHLAEFKELKYVRPFCAGGTKIGLVNSPVYFYFLGIVWLLVRSTEGMVAFFVCLGVVSVALAGHTGIIVRNLRFGFFWSLYLAVGYIFVYYSRNLIQPHPLLFLTTLVIWLYAQLSQNDSKAFFYVAAIITILFLATHIHLSFLGLLISWSILLFSDANRYHWFSIKKRITLAVYYLLHFFLLLIAITPEIHFSQSEISLFSFPEIRNHLFITIKNALTYWLSFDSKLSIVVLILLSVCGLLVLIWKDKKTNIAFNRTYFFTFVGLVGYLLMAAFQMSDLYIFHLVPLHTSVAALIAGALSAIPKKTALFNRLVQLCLICVGLLVVIPQLERNLIFLQPTISQYTVYSQISKDICIDIGSHDKTVAPNMYVFTGEHYDYFTGHVWMLLEKFCDQPFTKLTTAGDSFLPIRDDFDTAYVSCSGNSNQDIEWCKQQFLTSHPQYFNWYEHEVSAYSQLQSQFRVFKYYRYPIYTKTAP